MGKPGHNIDCTVLAVVGHRRVGLACMPVTKIEAKREIKLMRLKNKYETRKTINNYVHDVASSNRGGFFVAASCCNKKSSYKF